MAVGPLAILLYVGLGHGQVRVWAFHEEAPGLLIGEAVGLAIDYRINRAISLYFFMIGETHGAHVAELAGGGIGHGGKPKYECDRD
jgi:hypothetical protein